MIQKILNNKEAIANMCKQNLKLAQKERCSIVVQAYEEAYLEILNTQRQQNLPR